MKKIATSQLCVSAALIALGFVCSLIKVIDLPMGGAVTCCSMLFIALIGYLYGPLLGIIGATAYGVLQFVTNPYFLNIFQVLCDYFFAFSSLGLAGFFFKRKHGLSIGYLVGVFFRFVFSVLSGVIFFGEYASSYNMNAFWYSFLYNGSYIGLEALITIVIINIPPVAKAIGRVKSVV